MILPSRLKIGQYFGEFFGIHILLNCLSGGGGAGFVKSSRARGNLTREASTSTCAWVFHEHSIFRTEEIEPG